MNTPVSFEIAKLLKEKGFNEPCRFVHDNWNNIEDWYDIGREYHRNSEKNASVYYSAPTIAEVVMWMYERHGIWIEVYMDDDSTFGYMISKITDDGRLDYPLGRGFSTPIEGYEAGIDWYLKERLV